MRKFEIVLFALLLALVAAPSFGATLVVNCTGSTPYTTIQAAVNASAPGDTIVVEPCATAYAGAVIDNKSDLHLVSAGPGAFGAREEGVQPPASPPPPAPLTVVTSLQTDCFQIINNSFDISLHNFHLQNCNGNGVRVHTSDNILMEGLHISNPANDAVSITGGVDSEVTGGYFVGLPFAGVLVNGAAETLVADNWILSNDIGVALIGGDHNKVYNNDIAAAGTALWVGSGFRHRLERNTAAGTGFPNIECLAGAVELDVIGNNAGSLALVPCAATVDLY